MNKTVIKTLDELKEYAPCFNWKVFSFDTETTSLSYYDLRLEGISFCDGENAFYIDLVGSNEINWIISYLNDLFKVNKILIAHNVVFDLKVLRKYGIKINSELYCTMVADHLLNENRRHGLKHLAENILGHETVSYKDVSKLDHTSDKFYGYALNDAIWAWELMLYQRPLLIEKGLLPLFKDIEMPFQRVIVEMETTGITMDKDAIDKTTKELNIALFDLKIQMLDCLKEKYSIQADLLGNKLNIISRINFNSLIDLRRILFDDLNLPIIENTPTGKSCVGRITLDKLYDKHEFIKILYKYKIAQKLLSGFFNPMTSFIDGDGRIRPSFHDTGTVSGRLSCSTPNLQQLPVQNKKFPINTRKCFIAPKGYKMITCDYSGQELRVLTEITREPVLIDTFNKNKDMHLATANDFFNLNIPDEALYNGSPLHSEYKEKFKEERFNAKCINFGMAYGKGAYGFSKDFDISEDEAQKILDKYFAALPKVKEAIEKTYKQVDDKGYVVALSGRRRHFYKIEKNSWKGYPKKAYRMSFNFLIQGYSADMIRIALVKCYNKAKENKEWDLKTIATVHDEGVWQVKEEYVDEASKMIKECFETAVKFCVPMLADVSQGDNYGEAK